MPRLSQKTETLSISLPTWMIEMLDEICLNKDFSRSSFIKRSIKRYILHHCDSPQLWQKVYDEVMGDSKQ